MKSNKFASAVAVMALLLGGSIAQAADKDIVTTAVEAGSFKTLAAALTAADLVGALQGDGPFTVFAPTDEAFAKLPEGTIATLLKPENKGKLAAILKYHVVSGKVLAKQVVDLPGAKTLNGQRVDITVKDGGVMVDKSNVVKTDIVCSNGVIHVIDSVILPADADIVATATQAGTFQTLIAAAKAAGLAGALTGDGPLTVFAPTDEAFGKLPEGTVASLLKPENKGQLASILKYHVVKGRVYSEDALAARQARTLQGGMISIAATGAGAKVNDANLVATDIDASNGVIHVIDRVILPPKTEKKTGAVDAKKMIEHVVAKGAHLYNAGHHSECAKLYMDTMVTLTSSGIPMSPEVASRAHKVMTQARHTTCPTSRSWALRHELDRMYGYVASTKH